VIVRSRVELPPRWVDKILQAQLKKELDAVRLVSIVCFWHKTDALKQGLIRKTWINQLETRSNKSAGLRSLGKVWEHPKVLNAV